MRLIKLSMIIFLFMPVLCYAECSQDLSSGDLNCVEGNVSYSKPSQSTLKARKDAQDVVDSVNTKTKTKTDLQSQLDVNDIKSIRALRTYLLSQSASDKAFLQQYENQAQSLRQQLNAVN